MSTDLRSVGFAEVRARLTGNRLAVFEALCKRGTATAIELAEIMKWDKCSVRPRLSELVDMCHARPTGVRRNHEHEFEALSPTEAREMYETLHRSHDPVHATKEPACVSQPELFP